MGLELNVKAPRGRRVVPVDFEVSRNLTEKDMTRVDTENTGSAPPSLQRLTQRHHALARLLSRGVPDYDAALQTGYDISRISVLKNSPAFQNLLALHAKQQDDKLASVHDQMAGLAMDAVMTLRERLEENPDRFANKDLESIAVNIGDRGNNAPSDNAMPEVIELVTPDEKSTDTTSS